MAEHVMEDVGLLQVIELIRLADELARGEPAMGEVVEEDTVRDEAWNRHDRPAGQPLQLLIDARKVRDARPVQIERIEPLQEGVAGAAGQQGRLPLVERDPDLMLCGTVTIPRLVDGPVRPGAGRRNRLGRLRAHGRRMGPPLRKFRSELARYPAPGGKIVPPGRRC